MRCRASPMKRTRPAARSATPPTSSWTNAARVERQRVDGEIAAQRVGGEIAAEAHFGAPAVGLDVLAQRRRFDRRPVDDQRDRAVRDAGRRDGRMPAALARAITIVGRRGGGEVEVARRLAQQQIAHGAADQPRLFALRVEQRQRARERRCVAATERSASRPSRSARGAHSNRPGTMTPFSRCAGT